jgi:hypothetical protein
MPAEMRDMPHVDPPPHLPRMRVVTRSWARVKRALGRTVRALRGPSPFDPSAVVGDRTYWLGSGNDVAAAALAMLFAMGAGTASGFNLLGIAAIGLIVSSACIAHGRLTHRIVVTETHIRFPVPRPGPPFELSLTLLVAELRGEPGARVLTLRLPGGRSGEFGEPLFGAGKLDELMSLIEHRSRRVA